MEKKEKLLSRVPLFKSLSPESIKDLAASLRSRPFTPGEVLFREGDIGNTFYIVEEGYLEIVKALGTPDEKPFAVRGPGEFVGEMSLLNPDGLRTASVRTVDHGHIWEMSRAQFDELLYQQPSLAYSMVLTLSMRLNDAHNLALSDMQAKNLQLQKAYDELKSAQEQIIEKEKLERELEVARDIQMSILPQEIPDLPGFDFSACLETARSVGGDFYDFIILGDDKLGIMIGDVTDKGVPAAIFMAQVHALLRAEACRGMAPLTVLEYTNQRLMEMNAQGLFVTVLYGVLDRNHSTFTYARAGHELPILCGADGKLSQPSMQLGQPLGILDQPELDEQVMRVPPGSLLILYTDGITDERNPKGEKFGDERLKATTKQLAGLSAERTRDGIISGVMAFLDGTPQDDDLTLVVAHAHQ